MSSTSQQREPLTQPRTLLQGQERPTLGSNDKRREEIGGVPQACAFLSLNLLESQPHLATDDLFHVHPREVIGTTTILLRTWVVYVRTLERIEMRLLSGTILKYHRQVLGGGENRCNHIDDGGRPGR